MILAAPSLDFAQGRTLGNGDGISVFDGGAGSSFTVEVDGTVLRTNSGQNVYASHNWYYDQSFYSGSDLLLFDLTNAGSCRLGYDGTSSLTFTLPPTAGTSGQVLKTDGSGNTSWYTIPATTPAGSNTQVQFNSSGAFGASSDLTWDGTDLRVTANVKTNTLNFVSGGTNSCTMYYGGMPNGGSTHGRGIKLIGSTVSGQRPYIGLSTKGNTTDTELGWFANTANDTIAFGVAGFTGFSCNGLAESFILGSSTGVQIHRGRLTYEGSVTYGGVRRETQIIRAAGAGTGTPNIWLVQSNNAGTTYWQVSDAGNLEAPVVGYGIGLKEGTNAKMGVATLVAGTVTVNTNKVTANTRIYLTTQTLGGTIGVQYISARTAGTSFTITSSSATDTSTVAWLFVEPT